MKPMKKPGKHAIPTKQPGTRLKTTRKSTAAKPTYTFQFVLHGYWVRDMLESPWTSALGAAL